MTTVSPGRMCSLPPEVLRGKIADMLATEPDIGFFDDTRAHISVETKETLFFTLQVPPRISGLVELFQGDREEPLRIIEDGPGCVISTGAALAMLGHEVMLVEGDFLSYNSLRRFIEQLPHELHTTLTLAYPNALGSDHQADILIAVSQLPFTKRAPWDNVMSGGYAVIQQDFKDYIHWVHPLFSAEGWTTIFSENIPGPVFNSTLSDGNHLHIFRRV